MQSTQSPMPPTQRWKAPLPRARPQFPPSRQRLFFHARPRSPERGRTDPCSNRSSAAGTMAQSRQRQTGRQNIRIALIKFRGTSDRRDMHLPRQLARGRKHQAWLWRSKRDSVFAFTATPATSPESLARPEGTSTATTSADTKPLLIASINSAGLPLAAPSTPVPKTASTTRVAVRISSVIFGNTGQPTAWSIR